MQFSTTDVVLVKVTGLMPKQKDELQEFLRIHCINSGMRTNGGDGDYTGVFLREKAEQVVAWLEKNGAESLA